MEFVVKDLSELPEVAAELLNGYHTQKLFAFKGPMGAGKTTLIKAFCEHLGVEDEVTSPTYSIVNEYECSVGKIYHFDFYRVESSDEAADIGLFDYLDSGDFCFMEWTEKIADLVADEDITTIKIQEKDGKRIIKSIL